jgi:hypothetical protein
MQERYLASRREELVQSGLPCLKLAGLREGVRQSRRVGQKILDRDLVTPLAVKLGHKRYHSILESKSTAILEHHRGRCDDRLTYRR